MNAITQLLTLALAAVLCTGAASAQPSGAPPPGDPEWGGPPPFDPDGDGPPPFFPGGPGGFGGPPGGVQETRKLVQQFDKNSDKRLDAPERKAAREFLAKDSATGRGRRGPGPRFRMREENQESPKPGPKLSPADVRSFTNGLYDEGALRTLFLEFENTDWEKELADFYHTDVEVPARLTVDGKVYPDVGVHFRGASSFMMVGEGRKRSLNLSLDYVHEDQRLLGYRTLNLLNSHEDPTFLRTVLYHHIARQFLPAPKANFVRVVINGESWGVFVSLQQFNKAFVKEWFVTTKGARWKVPGSPNGDGGLTYLGEDVTPYKRRYEIKSKDDAKSWTNLIRLCRVLNQTTPDKLEQELKPLLDIDSVLKFLALENVFINNDGYWVRASDYNLYQDEQGRFHVIPCDANETFSMPGGPGFGGGRGGPGGGPGGGRGTRGNGVGLDPLAGADAANKPLLNKLLAVPTLRARYLGYVRSMAEQWLDWNKISPLAAQWQALIAADVKSDTRRLDSYEAFQNGVATDSVEQGFRGPRQRISLKAFVEQRRAFLLSHAEVRKAQAVRL